MERVCIDAGEGCIDKCCYLDSYFFAVIYVEAMMLHAFWTDVSDNRVVHEVNEINLSVASCKFIISMFWLIAGGKEYYA